MKTLRCPMFNIQWLILLFIFFLIPFSAHAQQPTPTISVSKTRVTYPVTIPGVGRCTDWADCHRLCDDPLNVSYCAAWATRAISGFQTEPQRQKHLQQIITQSAANELGCTSPEGCSAYCSIPSNFDQCTQFAKNHNISGGYISDTQTFLAKITQEKNGSLAHQVVKAEIDALLHSSSKTPKDTTTVSLETLQTLCKDASRADACKRIAKSVGLLAGTAPAGPGGCLTPQSCRRYCDDPSHVTECMEYGVTGPKGCTTSYACWLTCMQGGTSCSSQQRTGELTQSMQTTDDAAANRDVQNVCQTLLGKAEGKSLSDFIYQVTKSSSCDITDRTVTTKKEESCQRYLSSHQTDRLSEAEFSKYCSLDALPPVRIPSPIPVNQNGMISQGSINQLSQTCQHLSQLPNGVGIADSQTCATFVQNFTTQRQNCTLPPNNRPATFDTTAVVRYCLSVPIDMADFQKICSEDPACLQGGGYDWYCSNFVGKCTPLVDGQPLTTAIQSSMKDTVTDGLKNGIKIGLRTSLGIAKTKPIPPSGTSELKYVVTGNSQLSRGKWSQITLYPTPTRTQQYQRTPQPEHTQIRYPSYAPWNPTLFPTESISPPTTQENDPDYPEGSTYVSPTPYGTQTYHSPTPTLYYPYLTPTHIPTPTKPYQYYPTPTRTDYPNAQPTYMPTPTYSYPYYQTPTPSLPPQVQGYSTATTIWQRILELLH